MNKGDKVSYVVTKRLSGGRFTSSVREGTIEVWGEPFCSVKTKNGKIVVARSGFVTPTGEKNALTKILENHHLK